MITWHMVPGWGFHPNVLRPVLPDHCNPQPVNLWEVDLQDVETAVDHLLNQLKPPACVLGWSLGGLVALLAASEQPKHFAELVLVGTQPRMLKGDGWPGLERTTWDRYLARWHMRAPMEDLLRWVSYPSRQPKLRQHLRAHANPQAGQTVQARACLDALMQTDARGAYSQLHVPTTHLVCPNDALILAHAHHLQSLRADHRVLAAPGQGHAGFLLKGTCLGPDDLLTQHPRGST